MGTKTMLGTVLLIDDSGIEQRICRRVIERSGLVGRCLGFQMAEQALEWMGAEGPKAADAIFLDVNMPRMTGFDFLEAAEARFGTEPLPPILLMLTTALMPGSRARASRFAALRGHIAKPLAAAHLAHVLDLVNTTPTA